MSEQIEQNKTRSSIINTGALLIHRKGFKNTGLKEILDAAGVPKGSFYFYFKSKEDFGLQLIDHYRAMLEGMFLRHGQNGALGPLERFNAFLDQFESLSEKTEFTLGCPIGNMIQELASINENFRARLRQAYNGMIALIAGLLEEAKDSGHINPDAECAELAAFIFNSYQGAIMQMKAEKSLAPLKTMRTMVNRYILTGYKK